MLRLLRRNPVLTIVLTVTLCATGAILADTDWNDDGQLTPLSALVLEGVGLIPFAQVFVNSLLLFITAMTCSSMVGRREMISGSGGLVAWCFALVAVVVLPARDAAPQLLAVAVTALMLAEMMTFDAPEKIGIAAFNAGFLLSLGTLLYQPMILLLVVLVLAFFYGQPQSARPVITMVAGMVVPYLFALTGWYAFGEVMDFLEGQFRFPIALWSHVPSGDELALLIATGTLTLIAGGSTLLSMWQRPLQVRKYFALTAWCLVILLFIIPIDARAFPEALLLPAVPLSIFAGDMFHRGEGKVWTEALHLLLIAGVGIVVYMSIS